MCNTLYIYSLTHSVGVFFLLVVFTLDRLFVKEINRNRDKNKLRPRMCVCTKSGRLVEAANLESKWKNNTANRRCGEFAAAAVVAATSWSFVSFLFVVNEKTFKAAHPHIFGIKKLPRSPYGCVCELWMLWIHSGGTTTANGVHCNGEWATRRIEETRDKQKTRFWRIFSSVFVRLVAVLLPERASVCWIYVFLS